MKNIVLFGGGLHANVCLDIFEKSGNYSIVGIIDSIEPVGNEKFGYPIIGRQEDLLELVKKYKIEAGFISIGDNNSRLAVRDSIVKLFPDFEFVNAIHPTVSIGRNVKLGVGIGMMAGVVVNPGTVIEDFCILNTGAQLDHDSFMGAFSHLSCGAITGGKVRIGNGSAIAVGVVIRDRISIGENTVVGAGAVVVKDLPDHVLAYGNPAMIVSQRKPGEKMFHSI